MPEKKRPLSGPSDYLNSLGAKLFSRIRETESSEPVALAISRPSSSDLMA